MLVNVNSIFTWSTKQNNINLKIKVMKNVNEKEWIELLNQGINNKDLRYLIINTNKSDEAFIQLLKQNPSNEDLKYLIEYTNKSDEAKKLLAQSKSTLMDKIKLR